MTSRFAELEEYYKDPNKTLLETRALATQDSTAPGEVLTKEDVKELKSSMVLTGIKKDIVLGIINIDLQTARLFENSRIHPETLKMMEKVSYGAEYGLPIEKELLFKVVPEAFPSEIRHLKLEEQRKYLKPRVSLTYINGPKQGEKISYLDGEKKTNLQLFDEKINAMQLYHWDQSNDCMRYYLPYITERVKQFNYRDENEYLQDLLIIDEDKLSEVEKRMIREIKSLQKINEDITALYLRREDAFIEDLDTLPFPMLDTKLGEEIIKDIKYAYKYESVTLKEVSHSKEVDSLYT